MWRPRAQLLLTGLLLAAACGGKSSTAPATTGGSAGTSAGTSSGGVGPDYDQCTDNSECGLYSARNDCCGFCSSNLSAGDFVAFNRNYAAEVEQCSHDCPPCDPSENEPDTTRFLVATCRQGQCAVIDIRDDAATACSSDADCRLRNGNACCEECSSKTPIAVANSGAFESLVCGSALIACDDCLPSYRLGARARCFVQRCDVLTPPGGVE